jgi:hypothetical protein
VSIARRRSRYVNQRLGQFLRNRRSKRCAINKPRPCSVFCDPARLLNKWWRRASVDTPRPHPRLLNALVDMRVVRQPWEYLHVIRRVIPRITALNQPASEHLRRRPLVDRGGRRARVCGRRRNKGCNAPRPHRPSPGGSALGLGRRRTHRGERRYFDRSPPLQRLP